MRQAWNNGGPVAISWGWMLISIPILIIGFCLSELVAKYPTSGGIYWCAGKLGGPVWAWFTGWFNLIGLIAVVASVDYACATFMDVVSAPTASTSAASTSATTPTSSVRLSFSSRSS